MMHSQIEAEEIIEKYVRNELGPEERKAFEEHFFSCDDCFHRLEETERFVAGIRDAARRALLSADETSGQPEKHLSWWSPAFAATAFAALILAVASSWLYFVQMPKLRGQLAELATQARAAEQSRDALKHQLGASLRAEGNVPLAMLETTRDVQAPPIETIVPADAVRIILWIDVVPGRYQVYRLQIFGADANPIATIDHLRRNSYNALAASVPAEQLQPGDFRIRLSGEEPAPASLVAEYRLRIRRP